MFDKFKNLKNALFRVDSRTIYLYAFIIGCVTGLVSLLFYSCIHFLTDFFFTHLANHPLDDPESLLTSFSLKENRPFYLLVLILPALGGLLVGLCTHYLDKSASGTGIDNLLESFHKHAGQVRKRTAFVKFLTSTLTLSTGGSAGKEGPMALIGAGIGSLYGKVIKMGARARRALFLAGAAGGLGSIFRAPLGGAITAVEVLYKEDFEADALLPCIISSVTAYTIFCSFIGFGPILEFEAKLFSSPIELIFYVFLGLICSACGYLFIRLFRGIRTNFFEKLKVHRILRPAIGGLFIGLIGIIFPEAIGEGIGAIQGVIYAQYPDHWALAALFLLTLAFLKMLTTSVTIQSGGSGGVLIPALFIGAMLGGFFGVICNHFFPEQVPSVTPFIVVGMAAFFSSATNASLGGLVMVTEMTGGYELLPPLMTVAVISLITTHKWSIYRNQVNNKFSSQAHLWDMNPRNLQHVRIGGVLRHQYHHRDVVLDSESLTRIEERSHSTQQTDFVVENANKELLGLISMRDVAQMAEDLEQSREVLVAGDLISRKLFYVTEDDTLYEAIKYLADSDFNKVPVVRKEGERLLLQGYLRQQDILQYYYRMGLQHETPDEGTKPTG